MRVVFRTAAAPSSTPWHGCCHVPSPTLFSPSGRRHCGRPLVRVGRPPPPQDSSPIASCDVRWALRQIKQALRSLRFGQVTLTVQDGVVQVERTEREHFERQIQRGRSDRSNREGVINVCR